MRCVLALAASCAIGSSSAHAQQSLTAARGMTVEADHGSATIDDYAPASLTSALATIWSTTPHTDLVASLSAARFETGHLSGYGELHAATHTALASENVLTWDGDGALGAYRGSASGAYARTALRLAHALGPASLWTAAGIGAAGNSDAYATARAALGASIVADQANATLALDVVHAASATYSDLRTTAAWSPPGLDTATHRTRLAAQLEAGVRGGDVVGRHAWADASIDVRLIGPSFLVVTGGTTPPDPERAIPGTRFTAVGLRVAFGGSRVAAPIPLSSSDDAAATVSEPLADGTRMLTLRIAGAHTVELMGDFTTWLPITMRQTAPDTWTTRVALRPGTHRLDVRVDGGDWHAAPGLPTTADDFGGDASVLVVR